MKENTKTKTVLGIDLGVASIGWAMIEINKNTSDDNLEGNPEDEFEQIIALGSRIVPIDTTIKNDFAKGTGESKNHLRTMARTSRKVFYRYTLRRKLLSEFLQKIQILPEKALFELKTLDLYEFRAKALKQQISLQEMGRIFFHLNQKRGYKSAKINAEEATEEKPKAKKEGAEKTYLEKIADRETIINNGNITIGQYFYAQLLLNHNFRTKDEIFNRATYIKEFDAIWNFQQKFYPQTLTNENFKKNQK